jgi:hypothetical protein
MKDNVKDALELDVGMYKIPPNEVMPLLVQASATQDLHKV